MTTNLLRVAICLCALYCEANTFSQESKSESAPAQQEQQQQPQRPQRVRVSQGVTQGLLVKKVQPKYPKEARKKHVEGSVLLKALISKTGDIKDLSVISGDDRLVPSAVKAVKQWKYKPYLLLGQPVEVETQITVNYQLSR